MPPLPVYRQKIEATGAVQRQMNEWEPRVASGGDLLPIPSAMTLTKEIEHLETPHKGAGKTQQHFNYKTHTDALGRLTDEYKTYIGHGGTAMSESLHHYEWPRSRRTFGYVEPERNGYTGVPTGNPDLGRLTKFKDGSIVLERDDEITRIRQAPREDGEPGSIWVTNIWNSHGRSRATETIDGEGKLIQAKRTLHDVYGEHIENIVFNYGPENQLLSEVREIHELGQSLPEGVPERRVETTTFTYGSDNSIELATTLEDGTVVRRSLRRYDDEGKLESVEMFEDIPGQFTRRNNTLKATSYEKLARPLLLDMWWE